MDANSIEQQAARWLVDLDTGGPPVTSQMLFDFGEWLGQDQRHEEAFRRLKSAWDRGTRIMRWADRNGLIPDEWYGLLREEKKVRRFSFAPLIYSKEESMRTAILRVAGALAFAAILMLVGYKLSDPEPIPGELEERGIVADMRANDCKKPEAPVARCRVTEEGMKCDCVALTEELRVK